jgi:hypothetical protein
MGTLVLELNDCESRLTDGSSLRYASPGYAVLREGAVLTGSAARAQAHLHPRETNSQFWLRLGTEPLAHPHPGARHHADLAYAHLNHIHREAGEPAELVFAAPGHFSRDQLAILLGVARRCAFRAVGLVDSAVAAASLYPLASEAIHLDVQLHQCVITHLITQNGELSRGTVDVVPGAGLLQLHDRWARVITSAFIQQSRFDPMHAALSEQQLYDRLPSWLDTLAAEGDVHAELGNSRNTWRAQLRLSDLVEAAREIYRQIIDASDATHGRQVLLSHRMMALPGFTAHFPGSTALPASAIAEACTLHLALIRSEDQALRFVTRLPARSGPRPAVVSAAPSPTAPALATLPSHLVTAARAYRLDSGVLHLVHSDGSGWQAMREAIATRACTVRGEDDGCWLEPMPRVRLLCNDRPVSAAMRVFAGDRIRMPELDEEALWLVAESPVLPA